MDLCGSAWKEVVTITMKHPYHMKLHGVAWFLCTALLSDDESMSYCVLNLAQKFQCAFAIGECASWVEHSTGVPGRTSHAK